MEGVGLTSEDPSKYYCYKNNEIESEYVSPGKESYEGEYLEGTIKHGKGACVYANGDKYIGKWEYNKRHGEGKMIWANGQNYTGSWDNDEIEGEGTMNMTDGNTYEGIFNKGILNGKGKQWTPDGNVITATWENGKIIDKNIDFFYNDGKKYFGTMKDSLWHGCGTLEYPNGLTYEGNFEDGLYHGNGKENQDEVNYNGEWDKGLKHGKGTYQDKYGNYCNGYWDMGEKNGEFEFLFVTDEKFIITFENDKPISKGKLYLNDVYDFTQETVDELMVCGYKRIIYVEWDSEEIKKIMKRVKEYKTFGKPMIEEGN
ncbi:hypothetical protein SteCoe_38316 [Stentor coeruleus]|uniref:MORN repeat protein n=1 Tax=Stentor coeruleus TaxID=5963 RepID=A0A1R2ALV9_9CILI|nr:hypothetical protein SteCoe_38316 [Stentor coeruleus]